MFCPTCGENDYSVSDLDETAFVCNNCKTFIKNKSEFVGYMEAVRIRIKWLEVITRAKDPE